MSDIATRPARTATARTGLAIAALPLAAPPRPTPFLSPPPPLPRRLPSVRPGALAAALVEVFVPIGTLEKLGRLPRPLQLPAAALSGLAFPICECGSVPVARPLM